MGGLIRPLHGGNVRRRPEHRQDQGQDVRAEIPQAARRAPPPRSGVRAAVAEDGGQHGAAGPVPASGGDRVAEHLLHGGNETVGEEDHRRHTAAGDRGRKLVGAGGGQRDRLLQQQMAPGPGGADRQRNLDLRWQRDGHRVHVVEQRVGVVIGCYPVPRGHRGRLGRVTAPHTDQPRLRSGAERGRVRLRGPVAGTEQTEPESWGHRHSVLLAGFLPACHRAPLRRLLCPAGD